MSRTIDRRMFLTVGAAVPLAGVVLGRSAVAGEEPPALNPFGPVRQDRDDTVPGFVQMSDGSIHAGKLYMTRDKRVKIYDSKTERQREIPLRAIKQIECKVVKEWMEREWKFKELALDEKMYTGKQYPSRVYEYTVTLQSGQSITGPLAEIIYVQPLADASKGGPLPDASSLQPQRFLIHKRDKGETGTTLKSLLYVKAVKLGKEALEEGQEKAAKAPAKKTVKAKPETEE